MIAGDIYFITGNGQSGHSGDDGRQPRPLSTNPKGLPSIRPGRMYLPTTATL